MNVVLAAICNEVKVNEGGWGLDIVGACPEWWLVDEIPGDSLIPFAVVLKREETDPHGVMLDAVVVRLEDGATVGRARPGSLTRHRPPNLVPGAPNHIPLALALEARFDAVGLHEVRLLGTGGVLLAGAALGVRLRESR